MQVTTLLYTTVSPPC